MIVTLIFLCGIANFAIHKAVMESGHPLLEPMAKYLQALGGRAAFFTEFAILLAAMLLAANGWPGLALIYGLYTALNLFSGWLMLSGRI